MSYAWEEMLQPPLPGRNSKPRGTGVTMLIDKGMTTLQTEDLLSVNAPFIDFIKLTFGTAALYPKTVLAAKIRLTRDSAVSLYPGGTFFEIAL